MRTSCVIVDDEPLAIELLKNHIGLFDKLELKASFQNALEAFEYIKLNNIQLMFLDIQMPHLTGIELLRSIQTPPKVIFTTAYRDFAVEGFELNAIDYLLKPITFERFIKALDKFYDGQPATSNSEVVVDNSSPGLFVRADKKNVRINFGDILFVESLKDYIKIVVTEGEVLTKMKISDFEAKLPTNLIRVHRSFIVNKDKVTAFTAHDVEINDIEIPIGGLYKQMVMKELE